MIPPGVDIGKWVSGIIPIELLVPEQYVAWRPLVLDALQFVFSHLSGPRLAAKIAEQVELSADTPPEARLLRLISRMPGLQKLGQVVGRNRHLAPSLREALSELENGISDMTGDEVREIVTARLGTLLERYQVETEPSVFKEGSACAIVRFSWKDSGEERARGVFKVLKPHVPDCFKEDMTLLQQLGEFLAAPERGYGFAIRDVSEMLSEVRLLLEHELDFAREQRTLATALRSYRSTFGVRVPRLIEPLSNATITAMSEESGVKVTDAFPRSPVRRAHIAEQIVEALIAVPLFSRESTAVFHCDPHAGNLLYDEPNRELVVIDWALAENMSLEVRRQLVLLCVMMILRNQAGVLDAVHALRSRGAPGPRAHPRIVDECVDRFFERIPSGHSPGTVDAMMLLDEVALAGVHFPPSLFLFRKIVFTLDGVLRDISESEVRMDYVIAREFFTRWAASLGLFHSPLTIKDMAMVPWNALLYPARSWWGPKTTAAH